MPLLIFHCRTRLFSVLIRQRAILGGARTFISASTATLMDAVAEFNLIKGGFDTPLTVERYGIEGNLTHRWNMDGRYGTPRCVVETDRHSRR